MSLNIIIIEYQMMNYIELEVVVTKYFSNKTFWAIAYYSDIWKFEELESE